ncbi:hypothetical protein [Glycomyces xiaoerkulensis]|uniref:hypothetical protein n=1 Tax=Glycomyces xiaoerkulensis TaxID=2038139 RepID=UPI000C25B6A7|nr:hypothetical protein [Glycomyces xiaoerkulensis]
MRLNRTRLTWSIVLAAYVPIAWSVTADIQNGSGFSLWGALGGFTCASLFLGLMIWAVTRGRHFRYDPRTGRVEAGGGRGFGRTIYPRPGYERLEFSPVFGEVWEVARNGKRHRLPIGQIAANRDDWRAFVESFHPEAGQPIAICPPRDRN